MAFTDEQLNSSKGKKVYGYLKADRMLFRFGGKAFFCCGRGVHKKCIDGGTVCINERTEKNEEENFENSQLRSCDCS